MNTKKTIKEFFLENILSWIFVAFFLMLVYGIKVFNISISHDTEAIIAVPEALYDSWIILGRFGLVLVKKILGIMSFNPYIATFMMVVLMMINAIAWEYLFCSLTGMWYMKYKWILPVVFFTSKIYVEQNAFILQTYEVNLVLLLVCFSLYAFFFVGSKWKYITMIMINALAFSVYQSFVTIYISAACGCFLLWFYKRNNENGIQYSDDKVIWKKLGSLIIIFLISFVTYELMNKCVLKVSGLETSSYITDQVAWLSNSPKECIQSILVYLKKVLLGEDAFYSLYFGVVNVGFIVLSITDIIRKKVKMKAIFILVCLGCLTAPFLLTVFLGTPPSHRADIAVPFMVAFLLQYIIMRLSKNNKKMLQYAERVCVCFLVVAVYYQSVESARLLYTEYVQNVEDMRVAIKISDRIDQLNLGENPEEPVVFVGHREANLNDSCVKKQDFELIGYSFFEISFSTNHGTWVMNHYMNTLGYKYNLPTQEQMTEAEEYAKNMPVFPDNGSVVKYKDMIIVKLS